MAGFTKNNITTTDNYGTIGINGLYNIYPCERATISVQGNAIYVQLERSAAGAWDQEMLLRPGVHNIADAPFTGVRVRSAIAGLPATVSITAKVE